MIVPTSDDNNACKALHWDGGVVVLMRLSALAAPRGVNLSASGVASSGSFVGVTTFSSLWCPKSECYINMIISVGCVVAAWYALSSGEKTSEWRDISFLNNRVCMPVLTCLGKNNVLHKVYRWWCDIGFFIGSMCWHELLTMFCCVTCM